MPLFQNRSSLAERLDFATTSATLPAPRALPSRPLRIAIVTENYYPHHGGVCEHVHFSASEARLRGHHVDIITSNIEGAEPSRDVIRIGRSQAIFCNGSLARVTVGSGLRRDMRRVLRDGRYDIVHAHAPLTPTLPVLAIEEADVPVVGTFHAYFDRSFWYTLGRRYFQERLNKLSAAIAVSPAAVVAHERYFDAEWHVIPNGVDVNLFKPDVPRPPIFDDEVPTILFLGRLDPRNGLRQLIEAHKYVQDAKRPVRLLVVGRGPLLNYYQRLAGGDRSIVFLGTVASAQRPSYYAHSDIYACPVLGAASFGITILEAMACQTAVVCSNIPGFRSWVRHERDALLFPSHNKRALADSIVRLLEDETLRARLAKAGRETAVRYSWDSVTDRVLGVYAQVLGLHVAA